MHAKKCHLAFLRAQSSNPSVYFIVLPQNIYPTSQEMNASIAFPVVIFDFKRWRMKKTRFIFAPFCRQYMSFNYSGNRPEPKGGGFRQVFFFYISLLFIKLYLLVFIFYCWEFFHFEAGIFCVHLFYWI